MTSDQQNQGVQPASSGQGLNGSQSRPLRFINRDGTINICRTSFDLGRLSDVYHSLLVLSWPWFLGLVGSLYLAVNTTFAWAYYLCGNEGLEGIRANSALSRFLDCFFFSVQTLATIGYGRINPNGIVANVLVTLEALVGLLGLALATGLFFSRFSRPTSRVIFSNRALISPSDGVPSLMFRVANLRANLIVEAKINVSLVTTEYTLEGEQYRNFNDLVLERSQTPVFAMSWLIVHTIDKLSPLFQKSKEDLLRAEAEIILTLTGIDETFSQSVHSRFSYIPEDLVWNGRFIDVISRSNDGKIHINIRKIHDIETG